MLIRLLILGVISFATLPAHAVYTLKGGKVQKRDAMPFLSVQEHYRASVDAYQEKKWGELVKHSQIITEHFSNTPFVDEALFYLGVGALHLKDYERAHQELSNYLKKVKTPKHFEEAVLHKFSIAEAYRKGARKRLLGGKKMPKWQSASDDALDIYDEVVAALPYHEVAVKALFSKGELLVKERDYTQAVEVFQTLIYRFPKHPLAEESYIAIGSSYVKRCKDEYLDPDLLALAKINLRKFEEHFPSADKVVEAKKMISTMRELFAEGFYEVGRFFERTHKKSAAQLYYRKLLLDYQDTSYASKAEKRLAHIAPTATTNETHS